MIESWGSGTIKMLELCKESGLPEPDFINNEQGIGAFSVVFYKDIYTEENLRKMGLNERQIKAVMYVKQRGKITNKEYQKINNCHRNTANRDLSELVLKGVLKESGKKGAGAFYKIAR
ncbi:MAG: ATP-binding protein [bacterium]